MEPFEPGKMDNMHQLCCYENICETMLIEKIYAETIDIRDPEGYCTQPELHIMTFLKHRFVGRCRGGSFIIQILEILARSDCKMKTTDLTAEGYVDVKFRALVSNVGQWDIVTGVKIASRGQQLIVGQSKIEGEIVVTIIPTPQAETIREGQIVSVRVSRVHYNPDQSQASAVGPLLTCDKVAPVYNVTNNLSDEDIRSILPLVARTKDLLAARANLMEKRRNDILFFEALLYSYVRPSSKLNAQTVETKGASAWEGPGGYPLPAGVETVNLLTLIENAADKKPVDIKGTWSRDPTFYRSSPMTAQVLPGEALPPQWITAINTSPRMAFTSMLMTVYTFLKAINEMVEIYDTMTLLDSHKNIWLAMQGAQSQAP